MCVWLLRCVWLQMATSAADLSAAAGLPPPRRAQQHQRRVLHQDVRKRGSDIKKLQRRRAVTRYEAPFESLWVVTESGAPRKP